jgi:hypothetical protein
LAKSLTERKELLTTAREKIAKKVRSH